MATAFWDTVADWRAGVVTPSRKVFTMRSLLFFAVVILSFRGVAKQSSHSHIADRSFYVQRENQTVCC